MSAQGCLPGGVFLWGAVCLPRGCLPGGVCPGGFVCPEGGGSGGVCPAGCIPTCAGADTPPP